VADTSKIITSDKINKDGQVTLPTEIREIIDIKEGDQLQFHVQDDGDDGEITVTRKSLLRDAFGSIKIKDEFKDIPFEEARKRAREAMAEE
jgi:AbrB family looped-hinge helix DNA binding protein